MKRIKNKIAALICGIVLLFNISFPVKAGGGTILTVEACGHLFSMDIPSNWNLSAADISDIGFTIAAWLCQSGPFSLTDCDDSDCIVTD
jgi:hypothetical protein